MSRRGRHSGAWKNVVLSRDEQFALKRTALLREAARAFSARGYHQTSLVDVAQTLGVTKAALYYYVSNKQEILYECHMMALDFGEQALAHALQHGRNGREKVVLLTQRYLELLTSEIGSCAVLAEVNALEPENRDRVVKRRDDFDRRFRQLINEGHRRWEPAERRSQAHCILLHGRGQLADALVHSGWREIGCRHCRGILRSAG